MAMFSNAVPITPGSPILQPGTAVCIACEAAGYVGLRFPNGSILKVRAEVGTTVIYDVPVIDVVAAQTTATCTVSVLT